MKPWTAPTIIELRMDAEIGSYQDDFDPAFDVPTFVRAAAESPTLAPNRASS